MTTTRLSGNAEQDMMARAFSYSILSPNVPYLKSQYAKRFETSTTTNAEYFASSSFTTAELLDELTFFFPTACS